MEGNECVWNLSKRAVDYITHYVHVQKNVTKSFLFQKSYAELIPKTILQKSASAWITNSKIIEKSKKNSLKPNFKKYKQSI